MFCTPRNVMGEGGAQSWRLRSKIFIKHQKSTMATPMERLTSMPRNSMLNAKSSQFNVKIDLPRSKLMGWQKTKRGEFIPKVSPPNVLVGGPVPVSPGFPIEAFGNDGR